MQYASERDPQLVGLLRRASLLFLLGAALLAIVSWRLHSDLSAMLSVVLLALGWGGVWTLRVTRYEITEDRLRIRCGPSRMAIPWDRLVRIGPSADRRNAPALSFDRLQLEYRQGSKVRSVLISPANRSRFLEEIAKVASLIGDGDAYVRPEKQGSD